MDSRWQQLQELATRQHGHFTTSQAEAVGLTRPAIHYQLREGRLDRPERGVYRFTAYPPTDHEREAVLMLWSRLDPAVAFSHETALRHFDLSDAFPDKLSLFIDRLKEALPAVHFHIAKDPKQLLENCEAVMTSTTSLTPVLPDDPGLLKGHCFVGIGSFRPDMREYPDGLFKVVDEVYVDTDHALDETGDLLTPIERGLLKKESVQTIGSRLVAKKTEIPETAFYKAVGGALFDLYTADLIYKEARKKGLGTELEL